MIAIDSVGIAIFKVRADDDGIAGDGCRKPKIVTAVGIRGLEISLLRPGVAIPDKDIDSSGTKGGVVSLIAVDSIGITVFVGCSDENGIPCDRDGFSKVVKGIRIGGFQISLLGPGVTIPDKDIGSSGREG